ncbi:high-affinity iron transporter [Alicyclobacillus hesperidum]|uniref:High-affinity iron transporter n=1 Tax=Alicyclobacillus hesperidum TaxID=89784 RepID=A0A1H2S1R7_9BACL|nr:FTR1 family protein [Alicyclobacillus hesperidum]SDW25485.1 high-affinity iron transporter [Alicyclobacillus hesperidum]
MIGRRFGVKQIIIGLLAMVVIAVLVWQGLSAGGNPDPTNPNIGRGAAIVDTGILVFREGLETILVLSAITASLVRTGKGYWKPISGGAGLAFAATLVTWFVVVGIISLVGQTAPELSIQAGTGLLAIVVLLIVMNWFFHRIYWTGWISMHNRKKKEIIDHLETSADTGAGQTAKSLAYRGLVILGFTSVYREGFEVVLFLQNTRMQVGSGVVVIGAAIGLALTMMVAVLTFFAHRKLPYKRMLVLTGVMLGAVLLVMVGEQVQEMQQAGWMPSTPLNLHLPAWTGLWFSLFNNLQSIVAQLIAAVVVLGSYFGAQYVRVWKPRREVAKGMAV